MKYLLILLCFTCIGFIHPLYISTIDIKHNAKDKSAEITIRAFVDDVEAVLKNTSKQNIDLSSTNKEPINKLLNTYLQQKLQLNINDKQQAINFVGYELQKESVWIYAEINNIPSIKKLNFTCNWLYDFTNKQCNIINASANGIEKNYKLDYPNNSVLFNW